jgi:hypothetical protein
VAAPPLAPSDAAAHAGSGGQQEAGESGSAPSPAPPVRPPPGTRVFMVEPPTHLQCSICHDAFSDVREHSLRVAFSAAARVRRCAPL